MKDDVRLASYCAISDNLSDGSTWLSGLSVIPVAAKRILY
jgi:hypothetical protein